MSKYCVEVLFPFLLVLFSPNLPSLVPPLCNLTLHNVLKSDAVRVHREKFAGGRASYQFDVFWGLESEASDGQTEAELGWHRFEHRVRLTHIVNTHSTTRRSHGHLLAIRRELHAVDAFVEVGVRSYRSEGVDP